MDYGQQRIEIGGKMNAELPYTSKPTFMSCRASEVQRRRVELMAQVQ